MSPLFFRQAFLFVLLPLSWAVGQMPQSFKYQAIIRNPAGYPVSNRAVRFEVNLTQGQNGPTVYSEEHTVTTDTFGLAQMNIGRGTLVNNSPAFSSINWNNSSIFLSLRFDSTSNGPWVFLGSMELLSVPYALNGLQQGTAQNQLQYWNGSEWVTLNPGSFGQVLTMCTGGLTWTTGGYCPGLISTLACSSAVNTGSLFQGVAATGVSSTISYSGGNGGSHSGQVVNSTGVTGLTATLNAGIFANGSGSLVYTISGTPSTAGTASFAISLGGQTCTLNLTISSGLISTLSCSTSTHSGTLEPLVAAIGVSSTIPYTGGNGGAHNGQIINSSGITGLTATLSSGTLASGNGTLVYSITGTPSAAGIASFALSIGGQSCTLNRTVSPPPSWRPGMVHCSTTTVIVPITNPSTNKTWMDRNLGASQVASSSSDANAYGDLYQWGRFGDGHQCRNSNTTSTLSTTDTPINADFILSPSFPSDWRNPQNANLWQGVDGINNPCPIGYRLPTNAELSAERLSWVSNDAQGAFTSPLKLPLGGFRDFQNSGSVINVGSNGYYWSSTASGASINMWSFSSSHAFESTFVRGGGYSVRCIRD